MTLRYSFNIVDNTEEQCKIRNKQIADGDATFDPNDEQIINNEGGNGSMTVVAKSSATTRFGGTFELQLVSGTITCSFTFEKGKGATFDAKVPDGSSFTTNRPTPRIQGTTAHIDLNINGS